MDDTLGALSFNILATSALDIGPCRLTNSVIKFKLVERTSFGFPIFAFNIDPSLILK